MEASLPAQPGGMIAAVDPEGPAQAVGLRPGDCIVTVNGHPLRDVVDCRVHADGAATLEVERHGVRFRVDLETDGGGLGVDFTSPTFDGVRRCANHCPFCFLRGLPRGLRRSLYVKDDDYRYSFLFGNFVTLTNLSEEDWSRLAEQRLSPLYVSVHATGLDLRRQLLGNSRAPDVLAQIRRLAELKIRIHTQVVLCPGLNDGPHLDRTIADLATLYPTVQSIGVVPVGLTRHHSIASIPPPAPPVNRGGESSVPPVRGGENQMSPPFTGGIKGGVTTLSTGGIKGGASSLLRFTPAEARVVVGQITRWQREWRARAGLSLVYPGDELYLLAGRPFPVARHYDGFPQYENGIGMVRGLLQDWKQVRRRLTPRLRPSLAGRITLVCGTLVAPVIAGIVADLREQTGVELDLVPVANRFFGETVTVSGLLTGGDVREALRGRPRPDVLVLPRSMLNAAGDRFLDDLTPADLARDLGTRVETAELFSDLIAETKPQRHREHGA